MTIDTAKERERLASLKLECVNCGTPAIGCVCEFPQQEVLEMPVVQYLAALDVIDAQAAEIERLSARVVEIVTAISTQENNDLYSGGNLWRFWADKAAEIAKTKEEELLKIIQVRDNTLNHLDSAEFSIEVLEKRNAELLKKIEAQAAEIERLRTALLGLLGDGQPVEGGICRYCGRDYIGDDEAHLSGRCPAVDCRHTVALNALSEGKP